MNQDQQARINQLAANRNERNMRRCTNHGKECCCAPFCDYCHSFNVAKPIREIVDEWRRMKESSEQHAQERGDIDEPKQTTRKVCEVFGRLLDALEKSMKAYGEISEQDLKGVSPDYVQKMERVVRDAVIGYVEMYPSAPNDDAEDELVDRAAVANKWLTDHGFEEEKFPFVRHREMPTMDQEGKEAAKSSS